MTINSVLPAIVAGNAVLLKPSPQTPLVAERFVDALHKAGVPEDLAQVLHLSPALTSYVVQHNLVNFVSFTGSVVGGKAVERAAVEAAGFKGVGLEVSPRPPPSPVMANLLAAWREGPCLRSSGCGPKVHRRRARGRQVFITYSCAY